MTEVHLFPLSPRVGDWGWQDEAACRGSDVSTFYHPDNERGVSRARREMRAKAICASCPVRASCLAWALRTREPYGVWGGLSVEEREQRIVLLGGDSAKTAKSA